MQQVLDTTTLGKPCDSFLIFDEKRVDGSVMKCIEFWNDAHVWHFYITLTNKLPGLQKCT